MQSKLIKIMSLDINQTLVSQKHIALDPDYTKFIISRKSSAYLVAVNDCDVVIEPHYDEVRRFATEHMALALQNLSRCMLKARNFPDPCDFLLQFFARKGWRIEDTDIETFHES